MSDEDQSPAVAPHDDDRTSNDAGDANAEGGAQSNNVSDPVQLRQLMSSAVKLSDRRGRHITFDDLKHMIRLGLKGDELFCHVERHSDFRLSQSLLVVYHLTRSLHYEDCILRLAKQIGIRAPGLVSNRDDVALIPEVMRRIVGLIDWMQLPQDQRIILMYNATAIISPTLDAVDGRLNQLMMYKCRNIDLESSRSMGRSIFSNVKLSSCSFHDDGKAYLETLLASGNAHLLNSFCSEDSKIGSIGYSISLFQASADPSFYSAESGHQNSSVDGEKERSDWFIESLAQCKNLTDISLQGYAEGPVWKHCLITLLLRMKSLRRLRYNLHPDAGCLIRASGTNNEIVDAFKANRQIEHFEFGRRAVPGFVMYVLRRNKIRPKMERFIADVESGSTSRSALSHILSHDGWLGKRPSHRFDFLRQYNQHVITPRQIATASALPPSNDARKRRRKG
mmetsp:Transcript_11443/g.31691  ORF Transcript_11443/g.31691 Transcript_11443/m.31691 type:complete len:451 (-) Transcript_11443:1024-2376(-)